MIDDAVRSISVETPRCEDIPTIMMCDLLNQSDCNACQQIPQCSVSVRQQDFGDELVPFSIAPSSKGFRDVTGVSRPLSADSLDADAGFKRKIQLKPYTMISCTPGLGSAQHDVISRGS